MKRKIIRLALIHILKFCKKNRRRRLGDEHEKYVDCLFCVATSNTVKRLFSACKHILTDQQKHTSRIGWVNTGSCHLKVGVALQSFLVLSYLSDDR